MEKPFTLLLATDYSEAAVNAENYAIQLAKNTGSFLRVMHAFDLSETEEENPALQALNKLKEHFRNRLQSLNLKPADVNYECVVREGKATKEICEEAKEVLHDFIIVGTHGKSGFKQFVLGSHTWHVIKNASTPVLAIPKDASFKTIKKLVFATEYREGELPVINFLKQVSEQFNAEVDVLHITSNIISEQLEKQISTDFSNELKNKVVYPTVKFHVEHYTDIVSGIDTFCAQSKADWLVMSPERPFFLERVFSPSVSFTKKMSFHTHIPLLSIPDYYNPDFEWFWKLFAVDYSLDNDN